MTKTAAKASSRNRKMTVSRSDRLAAQMEPFDSFWEGPEDVDLALAINSGAATVSGQTTHEATITDDDVATVAFAAATSSVAEDAAAHTLTVALTLAAGVSLQRAAVVNVNDLATGLATAGATNDYVLGTTQVTFPAASVTGATQPITVMPGRASNGGQSSATSVPRAPSSVGSGDGIFADLLLALREEGVAVAAVALPGSASRRILHSVPVYYVAPPTIH